MPAPGYASLRHTLALAPDIVKVDISLTHAIDVDRGRRALASALISFADEMDMTIVAEGIETAAELDDAPRARGALRPGLPPGRTRRALGTAAVDRPGRPGRGLREVLHLGRDRHHLGEVRERPPLRCSRPRSTARSARSAAARPGGSAPRSSRARGPRRRSSPGPPRRSVARSCRRPTPRPRSPRRPRSRRRRGGRRSRRRRRSAPITSCIIWASSWITASPRGKP